MIIRLTVFGMYKCCKLVGGTPCGLGVGGWGAGGPFNDNWVQYQFIVHGMTG